MVQRRWSTLIGRMAVRPPPRPPEVRLDRIHQTWRRRLDDAVEDVFRQACLAGDLDTAEQLLDVLGSMHTRRAERYGRDRRISDDGLQRAREELARRQRAAGQAGHNRS